MPPVAVPQSTISTLTAVSPVMNFAGADHHPSKTSSSPVIKVICELMRLLFLHAHRETTRFFEIWDDGHAQPHTSRFTYRRAAFFNTLKSKTGLMVARAAALRTNINIDGRPLPTTTRRRTSSKACAPHFLLACAPFFHLPMNLCREWP